jgi:hypothetical protein
MGAGVLLGLLAVGANLVSGALGLFGKGLSVLGVTTLPTYISKYVIVNKALDSFTAALFRAGTAAKTGGFNFPQKGPTSPTGGNKPRTSTILGADGKPLKVEVPTPSSPTASTGTGISKLNKGLGISAVAAIAADVASDLAGRDTFMGKWADVLGTTAGFAGTGAALGTLGLGFGAIPGAIGGGLAGFGTSMYKNFFSDSASSMSSDITSQAAEGDNPVLKAQLASIEQQKKTNDQMAELINEQATANRLASMGLGKDDDLARRVSNLSLA